MKKVFLDMHKLSFSEVCSMVKGIQDSFNKELVLILNECDQEVLIVIPEPAMKRNEDFKNNPLLIDVLAKKDHPLAKNFVYGGKL